MKSTWATDWLPYVRTRAPQYLFGTLLILIAVAGEFAIPHIIGQLLDQYPHIRSFDALKYLGLALGLGSLAMAGGRWIFAREGLRGLLWLRSKQRDEIFRDANWSNTLTPGECVQRFGADARGAAYLFGTTWLGGANLAFTLGLAFWGLMRLSPVPALVITLSWPFLFFILFRYSRKAKMAFGASREAMRAFSSSLAYGLQWLRQTKLLDGADRSSQELLLRSDEVARTGWEARFLALKGEFAGFLMASLSSSLALIWLVNEAQSGRITLGSLVAFLSYLTMGTGAVAQLPGFLNGVRWASICLEHCKPVNPEETLPEIRSAGSGVSPTVLLECAKFALFDWSKTLDMTLVRGESLAVVGASGSGKTTLLKIWCGAPLTYSGSLRFQDGRHGLLSLANACYVPQWPTIFSGTIRENLALGKDAPDRDLWESLARVELVDEFRAQGRGLQTVLGEGGAGLSTGQKQRLSLARALLRDPSILILDDCLSGVDFTRGARIVTRLQEDFRDRTVIVSGQRDWWRAGSSRQIELPPPGQRAAI